MKKSKLIFYSILNTKSTLSKRITLEQLAFEADIELSQVHRVEIGKINPTLTTLIALAKGLGITLAELVG